MRWCRQELRKVPRFLPARMLVPEGVTLRAFAQAFPGNPGRHARSPIVNKTSFPARGATIFVVLLGIGVSVAAPDSVATPPKELVQYISAAKAPGLKDNIIRRDAVTAGWPAEVVDQAFASLAGNPKVEPGQRPSPTQTVPPQNPIARA